MIWTFPDDEYHPHYADSAKDYTGRLIAVAPLMADYNRLLCVRHHDVDYSRFPFIIADKGVSA